MPHGRCAVKFVGISRRFNEFIRLPLMFDVSAGLEQIKNEINAKPARVYALKGIITRNCSYIYANLRKRSFDIIRILNNELFMLFCDGSHTFT